MIYAFTYTVIRENTTTSVIFKILPTKNYREMYWNTLYMKLEKLTEYNCPMKLFVVREIICTITQETTLCTECNETLYQTDKCLQRKCPKFTKLNLADYLSQGSEIKLSLRDVELEIALTDNTPLEGIECPQCKRCKVCRPTKKCKRHEICTHATSDEEKVSYHFLNKIALRNSLQQATNNVLLFN